MVRRRDEGHQRLEEAENGVELGLVGEGNLREGRRGAEEGEGAGEGRRGERLEEEARRGLLVVAG